MGKSKEEREKDTILAVLKHSGEIPYSDLLLRGGEGLASTLLVLVNEGKVKRRQNSDQGTLYSLAISNVEDIVVMLVTNKPGIKATELVVDVIEYMHKNEMQEWDHPENTIGTINKLVKTGELVEVEYVLPDMDYRAKSLYFPKGTKVSLEPSSPLGDPI